jgi:preprotein translocase subunit SecA
MGRGTDIPLGGNPEFMAHQQTLAEIAEKLPGPGKSSTTRVRPFLHLDSFYRVRARITSAYALKKQTDLEHDEVVDMSGLHHRDGTTRSPAHRQSAARPRHRQGDPARHGFTCRWKTT